MTTKVELAGFTLEHPLINAAGTVKTAEDVRAMARAPVAAVTWGSITMHSRSGNSGTIYRMPLNALGLPNPGSDYARQHLPELAKEIHDLGKIIIVNVAGFSPEENAVLTEMMYDAGADLVEQNWSCPNVWDGGKQKGILCFDERARYETLERTQGRIGERKIAAKITMFSDPAERQKCAAQIKPWRSAIAALVCCNTFPNGLVLDDNGKPVIDSPDVPGGFAGYAGPGVKPISLGQAAQFVTDLSPDIQVVGVGGIMTGRDLLDYQQVGATAGAAATLFMEEGYNGYIRVLREYADLDKWK